MGKKIMIFVAIFILGALCIGCDATGSLSKEEESSFMEFLVKENYIDEEACLLTDGVGEGELHNYYCNVSVEGTDCTLYVQQKIREEDYRVFGVSIMDDEENVINSFYVRIDRKNGDVSLYEE